MENIKELCQKFKEPGATVYIHSFGLLARIPITNISVSELDFMTINFKYGHVDVFLKDIKKVRRPSNIIADFKWCYALKMNLMKLYVG